MMIWRQNRRNQFIKTCTKETCTEKACTETAGFKETGKAYGACAHSKEETGAEE